MICGGINIHCNPIAFSVNLRIASCTLNLWTKFYFWRAVISRSFFHFSILKGEENFIPFDRNGELKLFRLLRGMNGPQCNPTPLAPRILFLFTDGYFSDEPKRGAERLCESNILLVIIRIGKFNVKSINELAIPCGIVVSHRLAIPELIQEIRVNSFVCGTLGVWTDFHLRDISPQTCLKRLLVN